MDIANILTRKFAGKQWTLDGDNYTGLTWLSEGSPPSESELLKLWPTVQAEMQQEVQDKENARLSAIAKLEGLGLTVDEVQAAFGLKA